MPLLACDPPSVPHYAARLWKLRGRHASYRMHQRPLLCPPAYPCYRQAAIPSASSTEKPCDQKRGRPYRARAPSSRGSSSAASSSSRWPLHHSIQRSQTHWSNKVLLLQLNGISEP